MCCRYLATPNGVFLIYPGTLLNKAYDPMKRHWWLTLILCCWSFSWHVFIVEFKLVVAGSVSNTLSSIQYPVCLLNYSQKAK